MTGQDFQDLLDKIVEDLQTDGKGKSITIAFRNPDNSLNPLPLSSDVNGVVNAGQLQAVQDFIDTLKPLADTYSAEFETVKVASSQLSAARMPHVQLFEDARDARIALADALEADANYQAKKAAYEAARNDANYVSARSDYKGNNISENFGNLSDAKGKYE